MNVLIFDIEITGHHSEYIEHLADYILEFKQQTNINYHFIVHPEFADRFAEVISKTHDSNISFLCIPKSEYISLKSVIPAGLKLYEYSKKYYDLLNKYAKIYNSEKCILLDIHPFLIALVLLRPKYEIYGILFSPFIRLCKKEKLKYFRRKLLTWLYARNFQIKKVFILNDLRAANVLNRQTRRQLFYFLPDPISLIEEERNFSLRDTYQIESKKKIFLHLGSFRDTKGTFEIIKSLNLISSESASNLCIIFAGKALNAEDGTMINKSLSLIKNIQIINIQNFVSNSKMKSLFNQSDIILIPYKTLESSSGILGHAITSGKPVISNSHGLIGEIILKEWIGELIDIVSPKEIALAIERSIITAYERKDNTQFIIEHSPMKFSRTLLEN